MKLNGGFHIYIYIYLYDGFIGIYWHLLGFMRIFYGDLRSFMVMDVMDVL